MSKLIHNVGIVILDLNCSKDLIRAIELEKITVLFMYEYVCSKLEPFNLQAHFPNRAGRMFIINGIIQCIKTSVSSSNKTQGLLMIMIKLLMLFRVIIGACSPYILHTFCGQFQSCLTFQRMVHILTAIL
jgi:hypothetical protein